MSHVSCISVSLDLVLTQAHETKPQSPPAIATEEGEVGEELP